MADHSDSQSMRYLPVEVSGQTFFVPMSNVTAVHLLTSGIVNTPIIESDESAVVKTLVLAQLFWGIERTSHPIYAVVITTQAGVCAVAVDAVRPASTAAADDCFPLPPVVSVLGLPFSGVVRQAGSLILIIDPLGLTELLRRMSPDLIMERSHAV